MFPRCITLFFLIFAHSAFPLSIFQVIHSFLARNYRRVKLDPVSGEAYAKWREKDRNIHAT